MLSIAPAKYEGGALVLLLFFARSAVPLLLPLTAMVARKGRKDEQNNEMDRKSRYGLSDEYELYRTFLDAWKRGTD